MIGLRSRSSTARGGTPVRGTSHPGRAETASKSKSTPHRRPASLLRAVAALGGSRLRAFRKSGSIHPLRTDEDSVPPCDDFFRQRERRWQSGMRMGDLTPPCGSARNRGQCGFSLGIARALISAPPPSPLTAVPGSKTSLRR